MSATNAMETAILQLYFNNTDHANVGDAAGIQNSATAGSFYISLHTADPGETGTQTTSEATYTSYARVAVARSGVGWTISGGNVSNAAAINFPDDQADLIQDGIEQMFTNAQVDAMDGDNYR